MPQPNHASAVLRSIAIGCGLIASVTAGLRLYLPWRIQKAERDIKAFCSGVSIGDPLDSIHPKAEQAGLKQIDAEKTATQEEWRHAVAAVRKTPVSHGLIVVDGWAFARWFCEIEHDPGSAKITGKKTYFLN